MPRAWVLLCQHWLELSEQLCRCWWQALRRSSWTNAVTLSQAVFDYEQCLYPQHRPTEAKALMHTQFHPGTLISVIEGLVVQKLLLRREGFQLVEAILNKMDARGEWR